MINNNNLPATKSSASLTPLPSLSPTSSVSEWASSVPQGLIAVLKKSEYARVNSFDLIGPEGWELLKDLVVDNFPYLTLADLGATMNLGIMGKLDKYKSMPLNVPRVYQWVEQRAPYALGYWQTKYPEIMRWAELCKVLDTLLPKLQAFYAEFGDKGIEFTVTEHIGQVRYPHHHKQQKAPTPETQSTEAAALHYIEHTLFPAFAAEYPAFSAKHPNLF